MLEKQYKMDFSKSEISSLYAVYCSEIAEVYQGSTHTTSIYKHNYNYVSLLKTHNQYNFLRTLLSLIIYAGCLKDITHFTIYELELPHFGTIEGVNNYSTTSNELLIEFLKQDTNKTTKTEEEIQVYANKRYYNFERVLQEDQQHTIFIYESCSPNQFIVYSTKITEELYLKAILLKLNQIEKDFDTEEKRKTYITITEIIKAMCLKDSEAFNNNLEILFEEILPQIQLKIYKGIFEFGKNKKKSNLITRRKNLENDIENELYRIASLRKQIEEVNMLYETLKKSTTLNTTEVAEYLQNNKYITPVLNEFNEPETPDYLRLKITAPMLYYDEDYLETILESQDITIDTDPLRYVFYDYILYQQNYKIWTQSVILFDINNYYIQTTTEANKELYYPHPHLTEYGCTGNHEEQIQSWRDTLDYIGCFEQIISMVMNLNLTDSIVMETMEDHLFESNRDSYYYGDIPCFENTETGEFVSFRDIYKEVMGD